MKIKAENALLNRDLQQAHQDEIESKQIIQKTKDLQQLEQQERVTKQALERESIRKRELQRQVDTAQRKVQNLCNQRYDQLIKIEERQQQVDMLLSEKSKLVTQRNELDTLLRDVEQNIQPTQFKNRIGDSNTAAGQDSSSDDI